MKDYGSAYLDEWYEPPTVRRHARHVARWLIPITVALCALLLWALPGCRSAEAREADPLMYSRAFQQLGAEEVYVSVMGGDGHVLGQAYNVMGMHWCAIAKFRPGDVPIERIREFFPTTRPVE